jgi:hypothetical protein
LDPFSSDSIFLLCPIRLQSCCCFFFWFLSSRSEQKQNKTKEFDSWGSNIEREFCLEVRRLSANQISSGVVVVEDCLCISSICRHILSVKRCKNINMPKCWAVVAVAAAASSQEPGHPSGHQIPSSSTATVVVVDRDPHHLQV